MFRSAAASSAQRIAQNSNRFLSTKSTAKRRQDTDFVKRRYEYREAMKQQRQIFAEQIRQEQSKNVKDELEDRKNRLEAKRARQQRRSALSAARQEEHEKQIAEIKAHKAERVAFNFQLWTKRQAELAEKRRAEFDSVVSASKDWVTEDNMERHIERAVDSFFIAGDASKQSVVRESGV